MAEATTPDTAQPLTLATDGDMRSRIDALMAQPAVKRSLPALVGLAGIGAVAALYMTLADGPQRVLYSQLSDGERAQVVQTLESGGIGYTIDPGTGMVTVAESDVYRARMLVASDGSLAAPESGAQMLDSIPLGASRTLEGERLRLARERELMLTILEIDGIEAARVHLAVPERSVFLRETSQPSASVMVRLANGRSLDASQVEAIVNLVSGSVPGMSGGAVRVVDQTGKLLSAEDDAASTALSLQRDLEAKMRGQLAKLLVPMLGEGNFSTEVQVELDREELTSARETYDPEAVVRRESESRAVSAARTGAGGVPGALTNTPPPPAELAEEAPQGTEIQNEAESGSDTQTSAQRDFAVGREVAVSSQMPGGIARISVAVAVSEEALEKIAPADEEKLQSLVEATVGANAERGDQVTVVVGKFDPVVLEEPAFYETQWFAMALRYGSAVIVALLALLLGLRPILNAIRGDKKKVADGEDGEETDEDIEEDVELIEGEDGELVPAALPPALAAPANLREQVALAQQLAIEQPDRAVGALRRMLANKQPGEAQ